MRIEDQKTAAPPHIRTKLIVVVMSLIKYYLLSQCKSMKKNGFLSNPRVYDVGVSYKKSDDCRGLKNTRLHRHKVYRPRNAGGPTVQRGPLVKLKF